MGDRGAVRIAGSSMTILNRDGTRSKDNLFHSFAKFQIDAGETASFEGDPTVRRIITRVTGPDPARIYGILSSPSASTDLYMISPNGIVVGPDATITVEGAFHASTANSIAFPDGTRFSAVPGPRGALSVAAPESFGFVGRNSTITVGRGNVYSGGDLSLIAGNVELTGGTALKAPNKRIRVAATGETGAVALSGADRRARGGALTVTGGSSIDAGRGAILLEAGSGLIADSNITVQSGNSGSSGGIEALAGDLRLSAAETGGTGRSLGNLTSLAGGSQDGGPIRVTATSLTLDGGWITAETTGSGKGGDIRIDVDGAIHATAGGSITASSKEGARGDGGSVTVKAGSILLEGRSGIGSVALGRGRGGVVSVDARGDLTVVGDAPLARPLAVQAGLFALAREGSSGDGGSVSLRADRLSVTHHGQIASGSFGTGAGGTVDIGARTILIDDGAAVGASVGAQAGRGGSLRIAGDTMRLWNDATVTVGSLSTETAGDLAISLTGSLVVGNGSLNASATRSNGGNIVVEVGRLFHLVHGDLTAAAGGSGGGGNVTVSASSVVLDDSRMMATAVAGDGGAIRIASSTYHTSPGTVVSASSTFGFDGSVRFDTPLFGRFAPSGDTGALKGRPTPLIFRGCAQGGRLYAKRDRESLAVGKPLGRVPGDVPLPGERSAVSFGHAQPPGCADGRA